ncbi:6803_t:CDS:1, partial [Scutellospora calospora]
VSDMSKSKVINAICSYFEFNSQRNTLLVLALTGSTATKIGRNTLYSVYEFGFGESFKNRYSLSRESL